MDNSEFVRRKAEIAAARLGGFLIIPLRYTGERHRTWLDSHAQREGLNTTDISESTKLALQAGREPILRRYRLPKELFYALLREKTGCSGTEQMYVYDKGTRPCPEKDLFSLYSIEIYAFPHVAFFLLGIQYQRIHQLEWIVNPGYSDTRAAYYCLDADGARHDFSLDELIWELCREGEMDTFFKRGSSLFLEAYIYSVGVVRDRFEDLKTLRNASYALHMMAPLDREMSDDAEEDVRYVYAVRDVTLLTYRWGCCVAYQAVSLIVANPQLDLDSEMDDRINDELPPMLLALYQKYTCLYFSEKLSTLNEHDLKQLRTLHREMLEFKAYGVIYPNHISRWNNVRQIYNHLFMTNGVDDAIRDIDNKISILVEQQKDRQADLEHTVGWIITLFGILSIVESIMSILELLSGGTPTEHMAVLLVCLMLVVIFSASVIVQRRKWK